MPRPGSSTPLGWPGTTGAAGAEERPLRLLFVIETLARAGAETALLHLAQGLRARGHECTVAALWPPYEMGEEFEAAGIAVEKLEISHRMSAVEAVIKLILCARRRRAEVVHAHLFFAGVYTALAELPRATRRLVSFHSVDYTIHPATTPYLRARKWLHARLIRERLDGFSAVSTSVAEHYAEHLGLGEISVIPNPIPTDRIRPAYPDTRAIRLAEFGLPVERLTILMPGRFIRPKGHTVLLEALARLREGGQLFSAILVGRGPTEAEVRGEIARRGLGELVRVGPPLGHSALIELMEVCDLIAMPSLQEGFGLVAAEAMALERPLVASNIPSLAEIVEDKVSGWLVAPGDPSAWTVALSTLAVDPDLRARLARAARPRIIARYDTPVVARTWADAYAKLLNDPPRSTRGGRRVSGDGAARGSNGDFGLPRESL